MATSTAPFGDYEPNKDREFVQMFDKHMADEAGKFAYHAGQAAFHANQMSHYAKLINYHDQKTVGQAAQIIGTVAHGAGQIAHEVQADRALEKRIFGESGIPADKDE